MRLAISAAAPRYGSNARGVATQREKFIRRKNSRVAGVTVIATCSSNVKIVRSRNTITLSVCRSEAERARFAKLMRRERERSSWVKTTDSNYRRAGSELGWARH